MSNKDTQPLTVEQKAEDFANAIFGFKDNSDQLIRKSIIKAYLAGAQEALPNPHSGVLVEALNRILKFQVVKGDNDSNTAPWEVYQEVVREIATKALESHRKSINKEVGEDIVDRLRKLNRYENTKSSTGYRYAGWVECCDKLKELLISK